MMIMCFLGNSVYEITITQGPPFKHKMWKKWKKSRGGGEEQRLNKELFLKNKSGRIFLRSFKQQANLFSLRFRV